MESLPSIRDQIRESTRGPASAVLRLSVLAALIFAASALLWFAVDRLVLDIHGTLQGGEWEQGRRPLWLLGGAAAGFALGIGLAAILVMATGVWSAVLGAVLLMAGGLFLAWWRWDRWDIVLILACATALVFHNLARIRAKIGSRLHWSATGLMWGTTLWLLLTSVVVVPALVTWRLQSYEDNLRPESLRPVAIQLARWMPPEWLEILQEELRNPGGERPSPSPQWSTSGFGGMNLGKQVNRPPKPPVSQPSSPASTAPSTQPTAAEELPAAPEVIDELTLALWHLTSSRGEGFTYLDPTLTGDAAEVRILPLVGLFGGLAAMITVAVCGMLVSLVGMGLIFPLLRGIGTVQRLTVRVEVPRYTLRSLRPR